MEIFDTHAHLCDERYNEDIDEVIARAQDAGVRRILLASAEMSDSEAAIRMAKSRNGQVELFCSVGVHPHSASDYNDRSHELLASWISDRVKKRIVAMGEIGLDYHYDFSPRDVQRAVFIRQLELACREDIPVIIHEREASSDMLSILNDFSKRGLLSKMPGVFHCYSGSAQTAQILVRMGFMLGFDGPVTFRNNKKVWEVLSSVPTDRILIETDCPYLTPEPFRGKRNEPAYITFVLSAIADYLGKTGEEMARITTENACRLFRL
ncbi:MAG: TatD family hydrolase [Clostridiaceae bacterium]|nr:TatD family hydrolase [Clostridiaceae bacterium]